MSKTIPSKADILIAFVPLQQQATTLLLQSDQLKNQGNLPAATNAYEQLIATLQQQLQLAELNNLHYPATPFDLTTIIQPLLNAMLTQADVQEALGALSKAEATRHAAEMLSEKYLPPVDLAETKRQRALSLVIQGRFNEALVSFSEARTLFREQDDLLKFAMVSINIAGIREWLGDFKRALEDVKYASAFIEQTFSISRPSQQDILTSFLAGKLKESEQHAQLLYTFLEIDQIRARINRYLGEFATAERQFQEIMPYVPKTAQPAIRYQIAAIMIDAGRYNEGLQVLKTLEPMFNGLLRPKRGVLLGYESEALIGLGSLTQALTILEKAIQDLSEYKDPDSLWKLEWRRARALAALNRPQEALTAFDQTIKTINDLRKAPLGYRLDSTYLRNKLPVFEKAIDLACDEGEAEMCCRFQELIKSRILTATLSIPQSDQPASVSDLDQKIDAYSHQIDALEYLAHRTGWTDELTQKQNELLSARSDLMEKLRFSDLRWRSLSEPVPFNLNDILNLLAERDQGALTLFYQPHQIVSVLLQDGKCVVSKKPVSEETSKALAAYQNNLQDPKLKLEWLDPLTLNLSASQLVASDLLDLALQATSLIIVPHGPLHLLPWSGLTFHNKRLFHYCPIGIVPNVSCLLNLQTNFTSAPKVGLIGAPDYSSFPKIESLLYAQVELLTVEDIYASTHGLIDDVKMGGGATEATFWHLAKHENSAKNILHITCHGTFQTGDPMNSGLLMTDAKIDATEISRTRLEYDEVILSACHTGYRPTEVQGVALSGDDVLGLPGAFLEAGVRSVLVSIPKVRDDVSLEFMTIYHENREEGRSPLCALQATQIVLSQTLFDPYLWIGFTVYGCQ